MQGGPILVVCRLAHAIEDAQRHKDCAEVVTGSTPCSSLRTISRPRFPNPNYSRPSVATSGRMSWNAWTRTTSPNWRQCARELQKKDALASAFATLDRYYSAGP